MFRSHLLIALRSLFRDRYYALINISGLAIAMACCLILGLYLQNELTYDQHNIQHQRIYRVINLLNNNGFIEDFSRIPQLVGPLLHRDHVEVESYVRFFNQGATLVRYQDQAIYQEGLLLADPNVFELFTHQIVAGDPATALIDPFSIAISRSFATTYFGDEPAMGKILSTDTADYRVSLVFADLPQNTHMKYDALLSANRLDPVTVSELSSPRGQNSLTNTNTWTYLLLPDNYVVEDFAAISESFVERYLAPRMSANSSTSYYLEPLAGIHLNSTTLGDKPHGNRFAVFAFIGIGIFLLLIASINYINLATARSVKRAKEVGLRKVLGSSRSRIVLQFLAEALLLSMLAFPLSVLLAELILSFTPLINLLNVDISLQTLLLPGVMVALLLGVSLLGLFSGVYPAFLLATMEPLAAMKGTHKTGRKSLYGRQLLVLLQFIISIVVITSALLMYSQVQYFYSKSLGFEKENKLILRLRTADVIERLPSLRNTLLQDPRIFSVATSTSLPGGSFGIQAGPVDSNQGELESRTLNVYSIGDGYLDVMGMQLVAGRGFDRDIPADYQGSVIVNETAVVSFEWDEPIGKRVFGRQVIGVVADFNFHNLGRELEPLALNYDDLDFSDSSELGRNRASRFMTINIAGESVFETVEFIQNSWPQFDPTHPIELRFLDDTLNALYGSEQRQMSLIAIFSSICIFISCLGLLGLTAYTTEQRSKELGIRKVLGASSTQLILFLFKNIFFLVLAASLIAPVISFLIVNQWLQNFAYRTEINWLIFVVSAVFCILIAFITMAVQSLKTSRSNPVEALRYE